MRIHHGGRSSVGRAPGCGPGCRGFDPRRSPQLKITRLCRGVAQLVAHSLWERGVASSSLAAPTSLRVKLRLAGHLFK